MKKEIRYTGMVLILIVAFGDAFTTFLGLASVFQPSGEKPIRFFFCVFPALAILVLLLFTRMVWRIDASPFQFLKGLWFVAVAYDVWTSFRAAVIMVTVGPRSVIEAQSLFPLLKELTFELFITLALGTVIMTGCPILFSYIVENES